MEMKRSRVPAFGDWNNCNEFNSTTEYFDSIRDLCWIEEEHNRDRFYASSTVSPNIVSYQRKVKGNGQQKNCEKQQVRKQRNMFGGAIKPVDEDLYKIPPELLYKKSKKKRMVRSLWSGCMRVTCVA